MMEMEATASPFKIILGSSSIYRRKVLAEMGYDFTVMAADIDEKSIRKEIPEELVMALAEAKYGTFCQAEAIIRKLPTNDCKDAEPPVLITCDQVVVFEGAIREKPSSKEEARQFLEGYSGGSAATVSSVLVTNLRTGFRKGDWDKAEIEEGTILNVAGGLITEHPLLLPYVKQLVGTTDSLLGLPKALTERLIMEAL